MRRPGGQAGFIDLQSLAILLFVIAAVGGCLWFLTERQKDTSETAVVAHPKVQAKAPTTGTPDDLPERYHDSDGQFTISYPPGWQIATTKTGSGSTFNSTTSLASPSISTKVYITFQRSFITADCIPDYNDKPFLVANRCFSAEYLTATPLPVTGYFSTAGRVEPAQWYLADYHFKSITINAKELYAACLVLGRPAVGQPQMGFFSDHPSSHLVGSDGSDIGYLSACVDAGDQPVDYGKNEVVSGETILRSLRFDK